jgi:hypothetical protein
MHADIFVDTDNQTDRMLSSVLWVMEKMEVEITSVHLFGAGSGNGMAHWVEAWRRQAGTVNVVTYKTAGRDHLGLETLMTGAVRTVEADSTASSLCLLVTDNVELLNAVHRRVFRILCQRNRLDIQYFVQPTLKVNRQLGQGQIPVLNRHCPFL